MVARISGPWWPFRARYDFTMSDGKAGRFWREKFWKDVFAGEKGEEEFPNCKHKGLNYCAFQNDLQVAAFTKNRVAIGRGPRVSEKNALWLSERVIFTLSSKEKKLITGVESRDSNFEGLAVDGDGFRSRGQGAIFQNADFR